MKKRSGRDRTPKLWGGGGGCGGRKHRIIFKRSDIGRDKVLMCIKRITAITLLKLGITKKYTSWL